MAELIPYDCLTVSTDGGVWLKKGWEKIQRLPIYKNLKNVGSGIRINTELSGLCEIRSRLGVGWLKDKPVFEHRHGVHIKKNFEDWQNDLWFHLIELFIKAKRQVIFDYVSKRLTSVKDDLLKGVGLFNEEYHVQKLNLEWKAQRRVVNKNLEENPFIGWCWTYPYESVEEALKDEYRDRPEPIEGRTKEIRDNIRHIILSSKESSKKLSKTILEKHEVKIAPSTIRMIRQGRRFDVKDFRI